jgi:hypothetical protein
MPHSRRSTGRHKRHAVFTGLNMLDNSAVMRGGKIVHLHANVKLAAIVERLKSASETRAGDTADEGSGSGQVNGFGILRFFILERTETCTRLFMMQTSKNGP